MYVHPFNVSGTLVCECCVCHTQYDGMALDSLLPFQKYELRSLLCPSFVTTDLVPCIRPCIPWADFPWSIFPQLEKCRRQQGRRCKHLAERSLQAYRSVVVPSWLSSNRAWKTAPGVCDIVTYTVLYGTSLLLM